MGGEAEWESEAERWVRWARTHDHDAYWYFREGFFDLIVPAPGRRTLEVGCGEGRVARDLAVRGHRVTGIDTAQTLLRYAQQDDSTGAYARAESRVLPFLDRCFDLAVAYNSLQSLQVADDMAVTVREAGRVLDRGGRLCACVTHPVTDLGAFTGDDSGSQFVMRRRYFETVRVEDTVQHGGLTMTFNGWTYSLEQYTVALEQAGFHIEAMREPLPTGPAGRYERWRDVPLFLFIRAVKSQ
jgi:ubiquinone/menaquinone biosynthesis C-methylase UbiE